MHILTKITIISIPLFLIIDQLNAQVKINKITNHTSLNLVLTERGNPIAKIPPQQPITVNKAVEFKQIGHEPLFNASLTIANPKNPTNNARIDINRSADTQLTSVFWFVFDQDKLTKSDTYFVKQIKENY